SPISRSLRRARLRSGRDAPAPIWISPTATQRASEPFSERHKAGPCAALLVAGNEAGDRLNEKGAGGEISRLPPRHGSSVERGSATAIRARAEALTTISATCGRERPVPSAW